MKLADFDYHLPEDLIAQRPSRKRDNARMMVLSRKGDTTQDSFFHCLTNFLRKDDVLVINDTKVIPAKLVGRKETGSRIEVLLLVKRSDNGPANQCWEVLLKPGKRIRVGTKIHFGTAGEARIVERISGKKWLAVFITAGPFDTFLESFGQAPLPPYIKRHDQVPESGDDRSRYQTIYARVPGSVAAPTAGLHFSQSVLDNLNQSGVRIVSVTLHVGYGTFMPIETEQIEDHVMEEEFYEIGPEAASVINSASHVIAVGTTSTRVLESAADDEGKVSAGATYTRLCIYPGYHFKRVDGLITNFHLPRSSLYILVCAFAGKNSIECAYRRAVENSYRFYSYGDCMLIL